MLFLRLLAVALAFAGINGVGIILVDERGRFLVNLRASRPAVPADNRQRPARTFLARRWAILAGAIERGETPQEAALREGREETRPAGAAGRGPAPPPRGPPRGARPSRPRRHARVGGLPAGRPQDAVAGLLPTRY